jgi:hypothetical protein
MNLIAVTSVSWACWSSDHWQLETTSSDFTREVFDMDPNMCGQSRCHFLGEQILFFELLSFR